MATEGEQNSPASTPRARKREATRKRVIDSARQLFMTEGYQGTTIRDIARGAGVAVGSVFTTFASKGEILAEVMRARVDPLYGELDRVMPHLRGPTVDRLRTMFAIHVAFEAQHALLFLSHIAAAYDWTVTAGARPYGQDARLKGMVRHAFATGVEMGDIRTDADLDDLVALVMAAFAWTFRMMAVEGTDAAAVTKVLDRQIGLIVEGARPQG